MGISPSICKLTCAGFPPFLLFASRDSWTPESNVFHKFNSTLLLWERIPILVDGNCHCSSSTSLARIILFSHHLYHSSGGHILCTNWRLSPIYWPIIRYLFSQKSWYNKTIITSRTGYLISERLQRIKLIKNVSFVWMLLLLLIFKLSKDSIRFKDEKKLQSEKNSVQTVWIILDYPHEAHLLCFRK